MNPYNDLTYADVIYLSFNEDVWDNWVMKGGKAKDHWLQHGPKDGRQGGHLYGGSTPPPQGDCGAKYLAMHADVARDKYYGTRPQEHYQRHGKQNGRALPAGCEAWGGTPDPNPIPDPKPKPEGKPLKKIRMISMNDVPSSLDKHVTGDYDGPQTFAGEVGALVGHFNVEPLCFGAVRAVDTGNPRNSRLTGEGVMRELLTLGGQDTPVYAGGGDRRERSDLSRFIVEESKRGRLDICNGAHDQDIEQALYDGANRANIHVYGVRGSWNENPAGEGATAFVAGRVQWHDLMNHSNYFWALGKKGGDVRYGKEGLTPDEWIGRLRSINKMWDKANSALTIEQNRITNSFQHQFQDNNPSRLADLWITLAYMGVSPNDHVGQMEIVERGIRLMHEYAKF